MKYVYNLKTSYSFSTHLCSCSLDAEVLCYGSDPVKTKRRSHRGRWSPWDMTTPPDSPNWHLVSIVSVKGRRRFLVHIEEHVQCDGTDVI